VKADNEQGLVAATKVRLQTDPISCPSAKNRDYWRVVKWRSWVHQLGFSSWARFFDMCKYWHISWDPNPLNPEYRPGWCLQGHRRAGTNGFDPDGRPEWLPVETDLDHVLEKFVPIILSASPQRERDDAVVKRLQRRAMKAGLSPNPPWLLGEGTALAAANQALAMGLADPAR
jgi:hypothetical protein